MKIDHLSWSQINTLHRCGEQYRRRYVEGEVLPPGIALIRGRAAHRGIEEDLVHKIETGELLEPEAVRQVASEAFDAFAAGEFVVDGEYEGMDPKQALGAAKDEAVALAGLHAEKVAPAMEPEAVEVRIELPPSDAMPFTFVSILDVIDGGAVRDTKTSRKSPSSSTADGSDQLTSQDLAFRARYGKEPEELSLDYLVRTPKGQLKHVRQSTKRSVEDLLTFVRRARAAARAIEAEIFLPAPADSWACSERFCGYAQTCPYFRGRPRPKS